MRCWAHRAYKIMATNKHRPPPQRKLSEENINRSKAFAIRNQQAEVLLAKQCELKHPNRSDTKWLAWLVWTDQQGNVSYEITKLKKLSSTGACLQASKNLEAGQTVEIFIRIPTKRRWWMKYMATIVKFSPLSHEARLKFHSLRPIFLEATTFNVARPNI